MTREAVLRHRYGEEENEGVPEVGGGCKKKCGMHTRACVCVFACVCVEGIRLS